MYTRPFPGASFVHSHIELLSVVIIRMSKSKFRLRYDVITPVIRFLTLSGQLLTQVMVMF